MATRLCDGEGLSTRAQLVIDIFGLVSRGCFLCFPVLYVFCLSTLNKLVKSYTAVSESGLNEQADPSFDFPSASLQMVSEVGYYGAVQETECHQRSSGKQPQATSQFQVVIVQLRVLVWSSSQQETRGAGVSCRFSRSLIRLYNKMETTAPTQEEAKALEKLRNRSLRDQFSAGAREEWVRRELRRISLATKDDGFEEMRKEAIYLFQDGGTHQVTKVREVTADEISISKAETGPTLREMAEQQSQLLAQVVAMREEIKLLRGLSSEVQQLKDNRDQTGPADNHPTDFNHPTGIHDRDLLQM
ncbi:hypothetical protein BSL78_05448 [Apostichopus japonicus]|uniref:Uncharacterized protein n=1 Tax=Stichopus japonicus TaxID=307972 RepID=A0A2G8LBJ9_STIJA|nr:hypothetical protein BSL78_05448 [Apostichopus japonicus]